MQPSEHFALGSGREVGVPEGECHQVLKIVSLTSPVERLLSCRLGNDTVRFCFWQSESAFGYCAQFLRSCRHAAGVAPVSFRNVRPNCTAAAKPAGSATSSSEALASISSAF